MSITYCQCGCGTLVKKSGSLYTRGHHMRTEALKEFHKTVDRSGNAEKVRRTFQAKYGEGITNASHVKEIKERVAQTRRSNSPTWNPNTPEFKQKMANAGRLGGLATKARWEQDPELFKNFLEKGHKVQRLPNGNYDRHRGDGNPMADPKIKEKYTKIMSEKYNDPSFLSTRKEKTLQTLKTKYGNDFTKLPWIKHKKDHYRWIEDRQRPRGDNWKEIRNEILVRDKNQCFLCQSQSRLDVHHITPIRSGLPLTELNQSINLITLCRSCHMQIEWFEDLNKELQEILLSSLQKENTHG